MRERAGNRYSSEGTSTLIIRALMINVASSMPPVSAHQCHLSVPISAHQCHISVPTSAHQCNISVPI
ncbi:unnamed protein product [Staurois parvus]|uniref:Uncharacterized protein n=1 Tax=Staurois parvus TaxID=386267 RepID=A0ABN9AJH4_9NEOB|nr:unnamed protein product [Staurois parvus]